MLTSALSRSFRRKGQDKVQKTIVWGQIASDHCWRVILSRPGRSGGVETGLKGLEVGNHKRCTLNTRLSSGTSEHTSSSSRNVPGRMIRSDLCWYCNNIKMKPTYRGKCLSDFFLEGSGPPSKCSEQPLSIIWKSSCGLVRVTWQRVSWKARGGHLSGAGMSVTFLCISAHTWISMHYVV